MGVVSAGRPRTGCKVPQASELGCPLLLPPLDLGDRAVDFLGNVDAPWLSHDADVGEHPLCVFELVPSFRVLDAYVCWPGKALAELVLGAVNG